jgi:hypothetical protein
MLIALPAANLSRRDPQSIRRALSQNLAMQGAIFTWLTISTDRTKRPPPVNFMLCSELNCPQRTPTSCFLPHWVSRPTAKSTGSPEQASRQPSPYQLRAVDVIVAEMLDEGNALTGAKELPKVLYGFSVLLAMQPTAR